MRQIVQLAGQVVKGVRVREYDEAAPLAIKEVGAPHFSAKLKAQNWETVVRVRSEDELYVVTCYASDGAIKGFFLIVHDEDSTVLANVVCDLSPENMQKLASAASMAGVKLGLGEDSPLSVAIGSLIFRGSEPVPTKCVEVPALWAIRQKTEGNFVPRRSSKTKSPADQTIGRALFIITFLQSERLAGWSQACCRAWSAGVHASWAHFSGGLQDAFFNHDANRRTAGDRLLGHQDAILALIRSHALANASTCGFGCCVAMHSTIGASAIVNWKGRVALAGAIAERSITALEQLQATFARCDVGAVFACANVNIQRFAEEPLRVFFRHLHAEQVELNVLIGFLIGFAVTSALNSGSF